MVASIMSLLWTLAAISGIALFLVGMFYILTFWTRMLIDCAHRDFQNPHDKIVWILIILLCNWFGAVLYYFFVKNKK